MPLPFLESATGDPINLKRRIARQATRGLPATASFSDFRTYGGPMVMAPGLIDPMSIQSGGAPLRKLPGKVDLASGGPLAMGDVDPADPGLILFLANLFENYTVTSKDTAEWYRWEFALDATTAADEFLTIYNDTDVIPRTTFYDIMLGGFTAAASPGGNFSMDFPYVAGGYHFFGDWVGDTWAANNDPVFRKTWSGNWEETGDFDIYIQEQSNDANSITIKVKIGAAATYDGANITVNFGEWTRITDENDARIGKKAEQIEIFLPVGTTGIVASDTGHVVNRRPSWTPTLATQRKISSINTTFVVDGVESRAEGGWSIEAAWANLESVLDVAGRQTATVQRTGDLSASISPTRRLVDLDFQKKLHEADTIQVFFDGETDEIIPGTANLRPYRMIIGAPACLLSGSMYGVEPGGENKEEALSLMAGLPDAAVNYADGYGENISFGSHLKVVVDTDIAAIP